MTTPTPSPAPLSAEEQAELRGWLASPFHGREDDVSSHMADRLLATLTARDEIIAGLTADRDDAQESLDACRNQIALQMARVDKADTAVERITRVAEKFETAAVFAVKRAETAESRVKVLEEALRPFADKANNFSGDAWGQYIALVGNPPHLPTSLTVGDLRRAAAILLPHQQESGK